MKLKYLLLLITVLILSCSESSYTDLKKYNLLDKVKMITVSEYSASEKFGEITKDELLAKTKYVFNQEGFQTTEISFNRKDTLGKKVWIYEGGKLIKKKAINHISNHLIQLDDYQIFKIAEKYGIAYVDKIISKSFDASTLSFSYKYDNDGKIIEKNYYLPTDSIYQRQLYKYNQKNKLSEISKYTINGKLIGKEKYKYYENGNIKKHEEYFEDGKLHSVRICNSMGNTISYQQYNQNEKLKISIYFIYDSNGKITEAGNGEIKEVYEYDDSKNIISIYSVNEDNIKEVKSNFRYEYDSRGNWTKRISFKDAKPEVLVIRSIKYYK